jgi:hypothetical protein
MEHIKETITKIVGKKIQAIELVRQSREMGKQELAYNGRPFVLCGLPLRRPPKSQLVHERRNGDLFLEVVADPRYGLPFGQDRLIPILVSSIALKQGSPVVRFRSGAEILRTFGLPNSGKAYKRLLESFMRVMQSRISFGRKGRRLDIAHYEYFERMQLWNVKDDPNQPALDEQFDTVIHLSPKFWKDLQEHPIPLDMNIIRELSSAPGILDLYMWLTWRCGKTGESVQIPLFGEYGIAHQLGMADQAPRTLRQTLKRWLARIKVYWPDVPAELSKDGDHLTVKFGLNVLPKPGTIL